MFTVPKYGWVDLTIDNWSDRASYLTDVPHDILKSCIQFLENPALPVCVSFDAEGWEYILVISHYSVYVIESKDEEKLYYFDRSGIDLIEEVYNDINNNLYAWSLWSFNSDIEDRRQEDEINLRELLKKLRIDLDKYYQRFRRNNHE